MRDPNEMVMCIPIEKLELAKATLSLGSTNLDELIEYKRRGATGDPDDLEKNYSFKQVIPYLVLFNIYEGRVPQIYVMQRLNGGEPRLDGKYTIGAGGHIAEPESIEQGLRRELVEEVGLNPDNMARSLLTVIDSNRTDVDKVHLGIVYCFYGLNLDLDLQPIEVDEDGNKKLKGEWMSLQRIEEIYDKLESWSQITYDYLVNME